MGTESSSQEQDYIDEGLIKGEEPQPISSRDQLNYWPHKLIGALTFIDIRNRLGYGSAFLISKDLILTAAHNVYSRQLRADNKDFKFYLGVYEQADMRKFSKVELWKYPDQFKSSLSSARLTYDYAIMKIIPQYFWNFQQMPLSMACKECLLIQNRKKQLHLYGFPALYPKDHILQGKPFKDNYTPIWVPRFPNEGFDPVPQEKLVHSGFFHLKQYGLSKKEIINNISDLQHKISYNISTLSGQSGSPVVMQNKIIAIHVGENIDENVGRIIDPSLIMNIWKWKRQLKGADFKLDFKACLHVNKALQDIPYDLTIQSNSQNIDLKSLPYLHALKSRRYQLQKVDLDTCSRLTQLDLSNNKLQKINLTNNISLTHLYLQNNQIQEISLSANTNLVQLNLSFNRIIVIDLSQNIKLEVLELQNNRLQKIKLCISDIVQEQKYRKFNLKHQEKMKCLVSIMFHFEIKPQDSWWCCGDTQILKDKFKENIEMIKHRWQEQYKKIQSNSQKCEYLFEFEKK